MGTPSSERTGPTNRIAGWKFLAKAKPSPTSLTQRSTCSPSRSIANPRAPKVSNDPLLEEAATEPCLQTMAPAAEDTKAAMVETLKACRRRAGAPPLPTMSMVPSGTLRGDAASIIASTSPVSSRTDPPFIPNAIMKPATCASLASPFRIAPRAARAAAGVKSTPVTKSLRTPDHPPKASREPLSTDGSFPIVTLWTLSAVGCLSFQQGALLRRSPSSFANDAAPFPLGSTAPNSFFLAHANGIFEAWSRHGAPSTDFFR